MKAIIEKLDDFGRGITYVNNKITFIPKCIPNDEINFVITDEHSKYFLGRLDKVIKPSEKRIEAKCPFYLKCGGCSLQNLTYEDALEFKKNKVVNLFKRNKLNINNIDIISNPKPFNYRNKISLKIVNGKIGFYEEGSHDIVNINKCLLASDSINKVVFLLPLLKLNNADIIIRSNYKNEILLIINTKESLEEIPYILLEESNIKGVVLNNKTVYKDNDFIEKINNIKYQVSYDSFFQVNPYVASKMFAHIENQIDKDDTVYDLYSGVGALSLVEAKKCKKVIGVEIVKNAVINAVKNKELNNIENAEFLLRDLSKGLDLNDEPTCIVIDPPRSGIDKKTMNWILNKNPNKIIYVSCDPNTLVRDLKILDNYIIKNITLFDMFSYTYHCESITVLERK